MKRLAILGAGGHGKVVADCADLNEWDVVFFDDSWPSKKNNAHWPVVGNTSDLLERAKEFDGVLVAIGNNAARCGELDKLASAGANIPVLIHPSATISRHTSIGLGTIILAGTVINVDCNIGKGVIINTGSTVDHDCILGDFVHICPGTNLAGGVVVGNYSWVGIGSAVRQMIDIGSEVMVGAGAVVVSNISNSCVVTGVPARVRSK